MIPEISIVDPLGSHTVTGVPLSQGSHRVPLAPRISLGGPVEKRTLSYTGTLKAKAYRSGDTCWHRGFSIVIPSGSQGQIGGPHWDQGNCIHVCNFVESLRNHWDPAHGQETNHLMRDLWKQRY
jgi:hypothetical protein